MAECTLHQCVFDEAPWIAGSSPAMTSLSVLAMWLHTRVLLTPRKAKPKSVAKKLLP
jgi:hypothetical protein